MRTGDVPQSWVFTHETAPPSKYYVRPYSSVKALQLTLAERAILIFNKDTCIV